MPYYYCSLPNKKGAGPLYELVSDDEAAIAAFVQRWDVPGRAVYYCPNPLKAGATRRCTETIAAIEYLWVDIDFKDLEETPEEITDRLLQLPLQPTEVRYSGNGLHVVYKLKEAIDCTDLDGFERACRLHKRLTACLCGDPAPAHPAALLRVPGTHNSKTRPLPC